MTAQLGYGFKIWLSNTRTQLQFEETKRVIKCGKSGMDRQHNDQTKYKGQRMVYKTLYIKLKIEPHESKAVNRGRTDHTMTKQRTKNSLPILHRKRKSKQHEYHYNREWTHVLKKGKQFLLHNMCVTWCKIKYSSSILTTNCWMHRHLYMYTIQLHTVLKHGYKKSLNIPIG